MSARHNNTGHHRSGPGRGGQRNIFTLIGSMLALCLIIAYWQVIVGIAILCAVVWLVWTFRRPIWQVIIWISTKLWDVLTTGCQEIQKWYSHRKSAQGSGPQDSGPHHQDADHQWTEPQGTPRPDTEVQSSGLKNAGSKGDTSNTGSSSDQIIW